MRRLRSIFALVVAGCGTSASSDAPDARAPDAAADDARADVAADAGAADAGGDADFRGLQPGAPWPALGHDMKRAGQGTVRGPRAATEKWKVDLGSPVESASPVVAADGTIYVGARDGKLSAVDATGALRWQFATGSAIEGAAAIGYDGTIYFGSDDASVYAVSPSGHVAWTFVTRQSVTASPAVGDDGTIFVVSGGPLAIDPSGRGEWNWWSSPTFGGDAAPSLGVDRVYFASGGNLFVVTPWGARPGRGGFVSDVAGAAVVGDDGTVYIPQTSGVLAVDRNANELWSSLLPGVKISALARARDGTMFLTLSSGGVDVLTDMRRSLYGFSCGAVRGGASIDADGVAYFGSDDGFVYAVDARAALVWSLRVGSRVRSTPAIGADGTLYIGADDGYLHAIAP